VAEEVCDRQWLAGTVVGDGRAIQERIGDGRQVTARVIGELREVAERIPGGPAERGTVLGRPGRSLLSPKSPEDE